MNIKRYFTKRNLTTFLGVLASAALMALASNTFMKQASLLPAGFMGIATLASRIGGLFSINIPVSLVLVCINIPVAIFCVKKISKRFVFFSLCQILFFSVFSRVIPQVVLFDEPFLNAIFGGCVYGFSTALALRVGASTGGTDFIALYISNKTGREIWQQVFAFNCVLLAIFGAIFGWEHAGYSIIFQYVSTHMITTFHTRYKRMMLQIFTKKPDPVVEQYLKKFPHGITVMDGTGGYTGDKTAMLLSVTSSYELPEAIEVIREADPDVIINVTKSEQYYGKFQQPKL